MIGEHIPEEHERARAELADQVAQFLAQGGKIQDCGNVGTVHRPPSVRRYPEQAQAAAPTPAPPAPIAAPAATVEAKSVPPTPRPGRSTLRQFEQRQLKRQARMLERAELIDKIRAYSYTSLSRDAVSKLLGISNQQLSKLALQHDINFPKWRRPA
ncbi:hypothetical protein [Pseudomonas cremoricolorata]|uniref:Transcriptional regulator SutA RNAP-binding domain-containing protein n=1 Tax=Pseudomonas cremoricolorata TaxID=157783 RepID=A0A089WUH8_9PSED|nr:hypothetical protein [Pseudomonas cremoricolorata]AIR90197.1 hypothetical protein LK03_13230 [Pseudomonas cremoricolorata]